MTETKSILFSIHVVMMLIDCDWPPCKSMLGIQQACIWSKLFVPSTQATGCSATDLSACPSLQYL